MKRILFLLGIALPIAGNSADMSFHGTLVAPPCTISNGQTIEVWFGDNLGVNKIDGNNYRQPVNYTVICEAGYTVNGLAIVVDTATPTAFDSSAITTNKSGLGIRVLVDGIPATFAKRIAVSSVAHPPVVQVVPVQDPKVTLTEGAFEATMTLRTDYM